MRPVLDDRGSSPIQYAVLFPVVLALTFLLIQGVLWAYARNLAYIAARSGVGAGRLYEASPATGAARAHKTLEDLAGNLLTHASVSSAGSSRDTLRIRVTGQALTMLPGYHLTVAATMTGPVEDWTTPGAPS
ncbi:TadE family protein [Streptomyces sp. NPDC016845]|uniref:TadE family protein n=1 Tax=Streptomyces sp. NPDC016845 TaxID=3364972 RepID=UPI00379B90F9